jgi:hypothetical protein
MVSIKHDKCTFGSIIIQQYLRVRKVSLMTLGSKIVWDIRSDRFHNIHGLVWLMVFNVTFTNISVILWRSDLLVGETGVPGENH